MSSLPRLRRCGAAFAVLAGLLSPRLAAQAPVEADFYRAYYLEHEEGQIEAAHALYRTVAGATTAPAPLRAEAQRRADGLAEDLASSDLARLVPPDTIFYAEISRPGEELAQLLDQLGLLRPRDGGDPGAVGVSPLLVRSLLGMQGAAVAVTTIEMQGGMPGGVLILHPGDLELMRGLIETVLPARGVPADPIGGHPTWRVEERVLVTTTARLVVASPDPAQIEGVLDRLEGNDDSSLAANPHVAGTLAARKDGLLSFCLNAEPLLPLVQWMVERQAQGDPGVAMALGVADLKSLRSISGHLGVGEQGLDLEVALELAAGHQNLVFNLLRSQPVGPETLRMVPAGAAFFLAEAFNPAGPVAPIGKDSSGHPVVTAMDFGREFFGNLVDVAIFGLAPEGEAGGWQIPDVAAVIQSNDAERTGAVLGLVLDLATRGSSGGRLGPQAAEVAGAKATKYDLGGVPLFVARAGGRTVISPSEGAIARSLAAGGGTGSVLDDPLFAADVRGLPPASTCVAMANAGRCARLVLPFLPPEAAQRVRPVAELLAETVLALDTEHSETRLALRAHVRNIPDVSPLVAQALGRPAAVRAGLFGGRLTAENAVELRAGDEVLALEAAALREAAAQAAAEADAARRDAEQARAEAEIQREAAEQAAAEAARNRADAEEAGGDVRSLRAELEAALERGADPAEIETLGRGIFAAGENDVRFLNDLAWILLTEERFAGRLDGLALDAALRANKLARFADWYCVDTLALAVFRSGDVEGAIDLERRALELAGNDPRRGEAEAALARFLAARAEPAPATAVASGEAVAAVPAAAPAAEAPAGPPVAPPAVEIALPAPPPPAGDLLGRFAALAASGAAHADVMAGGRTLLAASADDPELLNAFAWRLLTDAAFGGEFDALALDAALRANQLSGFRRWHQVDTLALAVHRSGDLEGAIGLQETAIALAGDDERRGEAMAALQRYRAALAARDAPR
ncbi:MAG: hypothetical protein AB1726_06840 [Planctomycetota bacterium]